ncbi:ATP-independent RNA helicase [Azoarcus sp. CIB]|uniref:ATP-dependent RNA helicase DbpA n=1 Tax=Aromatoleum sp. (strain CIB) TaxID=198107 RepID=UPI0006A26719|nr:ATP-dependent RNA helicase DbpA [Azoarcus sp. CIB]AKU11164.1 ATP-independent RNA helicase [Azoarcus sp. CIB]
MSEAIPPQADPAAPDPTPAALGPTPAALGPALAGRSFGELPLSPALLATLEQLEYRTMTPIQAASLPLALAGHDLIAQAKTGSGKTAAFALTLLTNLNPRRFAVQAMVLCPTRELADQVTQEIRRLARAEDNIKILALCGGTTMRPQRASLEHGAHIVVGTPGRIMDHLDRGSLKLDALNTLVLDEADRMLDMGFYDDIAFVASQCPVRRQTLLFSATYPEGIERLAQQFLRNPQEVKLLEQHEGSKIRQRFYEIKHDERLQAVGTLLKHYRPVSTLAFCNTKQQCRELVEVLHKQGFHALTLNGDLEQRERDQVLIQFANRSCSVLVATDVAARGLDIAQLEAVINVDVTPDPEVHIHRIGRTGRADEDGWALTLCSPADKRRVATIAQMMGSEPEWHGLGSLQGGDDSPLVPPMVTLQILGGRKDKIRPGDVLGALTGEAGFTREQVGKITVTDQTTYVAVVRDIAREAARRLSAGRLKGKPVKVRALAD